MNELIKYKNCEFAKNKLIIAETITKEEWEKIGYDKKYLVTGYDIENMILLTNIEYLCIEKNGCWKSDESFGEMILLGRRRTNKRIHFLKDEGWFEINTINIKGGKKRRLQWSFKTIDEIPQVSPETIDEIPQVSPETIVQVSPETIDNSRARSNSIDNNIEEERIEKNPKEIFDDAGPEIEKSQPEKSPMVQGVSDSAYEKSLKYEKMKEDGAVFSKVYNLLTEEEKNIFLL
jgi:hypothetical protein